MINYESFSMIAGLAIAVTLIVLARRSKIHATHFIWWVPIILTILVFGFFPSLINIVGRFLGVSYPPIVICVAAIGVLFIKIILMDIYITRNDIRYRAVAQKTALLEKRIEELEELTDRIESQEQ